jgi:hypothetical protein
MAGRVGGTAANERRRVDHTYFPRQWWTCRAFVADLARRQYAVYDPECDGGVRRSMPEGAYWYMYEAWQDGRMSERSEVLQGPLTDTAILARARRDDKARPELEPVHVEDVA